MVAVRLPAGLVASGSAPPVCSRHGSPPTTHRKATFISRPPGWSYLLLLIATLIFLIVVLSTRKSVTAPGWSFCGRCQSRRKSFLLGGLGLLVGCVLAFVGALASVSQPTESDPNPSGAVPAILFLLSVVALIAGVVLVGRSAAPIIAGGVTSRDGLWVEFAKPAPAFAQWVQSIPQPQPWAQPQYGQPQYGAQPQYGTPPQQGYQA